MSKYKRFKKEDFGAVSKGAFRRCYPSSPDSPGWIVAVFFCLFFPNKTFLFFKILRDLCTQPRTHNPKTRRLMFFHLSRPGALLVTCFKDGGMGLQRSTGSRFSAKEQEAYFFLFIL